MIEFGATLRAAREARGLTPAQLAQSTHLMAQQIEALENEDFSKIAAPIYGRGFVKLYCEGVGLDPKPMIDEFMEIFSGNRQPAIRMRASASTPAPAPAPAPAPEPVIDAEPPVAPDFGLPPAPVAEEPVAEEPVDDEPVVEEPLVADDGFRLESEVIPSRPVAPKPPQPATLPPDAPAAGNGLLFPQDAPAEAARPRGPSRYTTPVPIDDDDGSFRFSLPNIRIPRAVWRIALLALAGAFVLWMIYACLHSLYLASVRDTTGAEIAIPEANGTDAGDKAGPGSDKATNRMTVPVAPLYID